MVRVELTSGDGQQAAWENICSGGRYKRQEGWEDGDRLVWASAPGLRLTYILPDCYSPLLGSQTCHDNTRKLNYSSIKVKLIVASHFVPLHISNTLYDFPIMFSVWLKFCCHFKIRKLTGSLLIAPCEAHLDLWPKWSRFAPQEECNAFRTSDQ